MRSGHERQASRETFRKQKWGQPDWADTHAGSPCYFCSGGPHVLSPFYLWKCGWQLSCSHSPLGFGHAWVDGLFFSLWSLTCSTKVSQRIAYLSEILHLEVDEATDSFFWGEAEHTVYDLSLSESVAYEKKDINGDQGAKEWAPLETFWLSLWLLGPASLFPIVSISTEDPLG